MRSLALTVCALLSSGVATGCGDTCDAPEEPEYDCTPAVSGTANTCGGPMWNGVTYDQDKVFPVGCTVRLPACVGAYPDSVQTCTCGLGGSDPPKWGCPV